jgi:glycosyltransferase involved in cell wall biosynthesis
LGRIRIGACARRVGFTVTRQRTLVLTPRFPYPEISGDRIRILNICRALSTRFDLTLLSLCESPAEMEFRPQDGLFSAIERVHLPRFRSYVNTARAILGRRPLQLAYYDSAEFREKVRFLSPRHDLVLAHLIRVGQYIEDLPGFRILEMTDAISMTYLRMQQLRGNYSWKRLVYLIEQKRLNQYESQTLQKFNRVWLTSNVDRNFLDPAHLRSIEIIPNGVDLETLACRPADPNGNVIVFIGNMVSLPNQDACHYFIKNILPGVRKQANVVFRIVGSAHDRVRQQFRKYAGVQMTGRIEHIRDGVEGAFCGVCPMRAAAGIQNKLLEYLALELPCVVSEIGLGGVEALSGEELLVYKDPGEAIQHILRLHADPALRLRMATAGRRLACEKYHWQNIYQSVINSCAEGMTAPWVPLDSPPETGVTAAVISVIK